MNLKRIFCLLLAAVLTAAILPAGALAAEAAEYHVVGNETLLAFPDAKPVTDGNGTLFIPLYFACGGLDTKAEWNADTGSVTVRMDSGEIVMTFAPSDECLSVTQGGESVSLSAQPFIKEGRTYVPLDFFSALMGCKAKYDRGIGTVLLTSPGYSANGAAPAQGGASSSALLKFTAFDGYELEGKLDMPKGADEVPTLVIFVPGTGPNTYDNRRQLGDTTFNYYDLFANELASRGAAFFRYNTRGVSEGGEPPMYADIDMESYKTYTPENQVKDIEVMVTELKKDARLKNAKVVLLGWSEGTIIAPLAAESKSIKVDSLMLAGYCNVKMQDIIEWQLEGESSMIFYRRYFDTDLDGVVSEGEFEADPYGLRPSMFGEIGFSYIDSNADGSITKDDFAAMLAEQKKQVMDAIAARDAEWIWNNYFQVTPEWLDGHAAIEANSERLLKLDIPVNIFHGVYDQNVPVQGVYDVFDSLTLNGKTNLSAFIFDGHDHDLNYVDYLLGGRVPQGIARIFDECAKVR